VGAGRSGGDASGVGTIVHEGLRLSAAAIAAFTLYTWRLQLRSIKMPVSTWSSTQSPKGSRTPPLDENGANTLRTPHTPRKSRVTYAATSVHQGSSARPARCQLSTTTSYTLVLLEITQMIHPFTNFTPTPTHMQPQLCPSIYLAAHEQLFAWFLRLLLAYCIAWLLNWSPTRYFVDPFIFHAWRALFTYLAFTRWFSLFSFEMRSCVVMVGIGDPGLTIVMAVVGALMAFWEVILGKC